MSERFISRRATVVAAPVLMALVLAGCSAIGAGGPAACPPVAILGDTEKITLFGPGAREAGNVALSAEFVGYNAECKAVDEGTEVALVLAMDVRRGPASRADSYELPIFVAIPAYFPKPQAKAVLTTAVSFPEGVNELRHQDEGIVVTIPASAEQPPEVFVGFQLTEDELRFNRQER